MDVSFQQSPTGRLVATVNGAQAFVPNPLPPVIDSGRHIKCLADASSALGELSGSARRLSNPALLLRPLQSREALTSSAIEGTYSTDEDLALLDAGASENTRNATREVSNYADALKAALEQIEIGSPITQFLIRAIHRRLLDDVDGLQPGVRPGEFKTEQNFIGGRRGRIDLARYIPPPPLVSADTMGQLEAYLARDSGSRPHPLIDAALVHYQFEAIHPFADGNGRVGRILIPLVLKAGGVAGAKLLYVSPHIEKTKDDYIRFMYEVSRVGAWDDWIEYFLIAVRESARSATETMERLISLQDRYAQIARQKSQSANLGVLANLLFERPVVTIPFVRDRIGVTYRAALGLVMKLVDAGVLIEATGRPVRTFVARDIIRMARESSSA